MVLDVNVLLALTRDQHVHHVVAHERFAELDSWCTCLATEAWRRQFTDLQLINLAASDDIQLATFDGAIEATLVPEDRRWVDVWSR